MTTTSSMMRTKIIGDQTYAIVLLPARKAFKIGTEILQMVAPVIGALLDDDKNQDIRFEGSTLFTEIALHIVNHINSDKLLSICDTLLAEVYKGSQQVDIDNEFKGKLPKMVTLLEFALKENFGDFFTSYFKEKGFEIPSLEELLKKVQTEPLLNKESQEKTQ